MCNINSFVFHMVHKAVFIIDMTAVFPLQIACQRFWFSDSIHTAVTLNILDELIDPS